MTITEIKLEFEPRDLWVGVYIGGDESDSFVGYRSIYVCLVPMFPLRITFAFDKRT